MFNKFQQNSTKESKVNKSKYNIIINIILLSFMILSCSKSKDVVYHYQRSGVQPCGVCGSKKAK